MSEQNLTVTAIFGAVHKKGFVEISMPSRHVLVEPNEARAHALAILEAAEAADADEFIVKFFMKQCRLTLEEAAQVLQDFRCFREEKYGDQLFDDVQDDVLNNRDLEEK